MEIATGGSGRGAPQGGQGGGRPPPRSEGEVIADGHLARRAPKDEDRGRQGAIPIRVQMEFKDPPQGTLPKGGAAGGPPARLPQEDGPLGRVGPTQGANHEGPSRPQRVAGGLGTRVEVQAVGRGGAPQATPHERKYRHDDTNTT